jgi:copper chaperone CopZ
MGNLRLFMIISILTMVFWVGQAKASDQKVVLMLGGHSCESYPEKITEVLMAVTGVKSVDLNSMKGHAIVIHDGNVKPEDLVRAIEGVKGNYMDVEWYCTAQVME